MAQQFLNLGTTNGEDGDFVRDAHDKINDNFTELYNLQDFTSRIIDGSATWTSGLNFDVIVSLYVFNGELLPAYDDTISIEGIRTPIVDTVTLSAADVTNPRIDLIVVNSDDTISIVEGTPAADPATPSIDFESQLEITSVLIPAGATEPDGVSTENIYLENAGESTEWTTTESTSGARINLASTSDPYAGTNHIESNGAVRGDYIEFFDDTSWDSSDVSTLNLRIKNLDSVGFIGFNTYFSVTFMDSNGAVSESVRMYNGVHGYNLFNTTSYQNVAISLESVAFKANDFTGIRITWHSSNWDLAIDNVSLSLGTDQPGSGVNTFLNLTDVLDTTYDGKDGYIPIVSGGKLQLGEVSFDDLFSLVNIDGYIGNRYDIDDSNASGFSFTRTTNTRIGYDVINDSTGNAATAAFVARGLGSTDYDNAISMQFWGSNYFGTSLQGKGGLFTDTNMVFAGINSASFQWYSTTDTSVSNLPATPQMELTQAGTLKISNYGSGTFTGTATYSLQVDSSGNIIEGSSAAGGTEIIDEGNGNGLVITGRTAANYGNVGLRARDFSYSNGTSTARGSLGNYSATFGLNNENAVDYGIMGGLDNNNVSSGLGTNFSAALFVYGAYQNIGDNIAVSTIFGERSDISYVATSGNSYITQALFNCFHTGGGNDFYAGWGSNMMGVALVNGAGGSTVLGVGNRDLTQATAGQGVNSLDTDRKIGNGSTNDEADSPRFIVGCGTGLTWDSGTSGGKGSTSISNRGNGLVVWGDGTVYAPMQTLSVIDSPSIPNLATGTTDSTSANTLSDSSATFTSFNNIKVGDIVYNVTDDTSSTITTVTSDTVLTIADDIFVSGESYEVHPQNYSDRTLITKEYLYSNVANKVKITLSAAEIKNIGSTPITAIAAQGAGTYIRINQVDYKLNYNSVAFDANDLYVITDTLTVNNQNAQSYIYDLLDSTTSGIYSGDFGGSANAIYLENSDVIITGTDSVANGDSTIDIYITYEIITL